MDNYRFHVNVEKDIFPFQFLHTSIYWKTILFFHVFVAISISLIMKRCSYKELHVTWSVGKETSGKGAHARPEGSMLENDAIACKSVNKQIIEGLNHVFMYFRSYFSSNVRQEDKINNA